MFTTFHIAKVAFLAFAMGDGFGIVDETGQWYGAWQTVERFRKQAASDGISALSLGTVHGLSVVR